MHIIHNLLFPSLGINAPGDLYYRVDNGRVDASLNESGINLSKGAVVSFDTY